MVKGKIMVDIAKAMSIKAFRLGFRVKVGMRGLSINKRVKGRIIVMQRILVMMRITPGPQMRNDLDIRRGDLLIKIVKKKHKRRRGRRRLSQRSPRVWLV